MSYKEAEVGLEQDVIDQIDHIEIRLEGKKNGEVIAVHYRRQRMSDSIEREAFDIMWKSILHADDIIQAKKKWMNDREEYLEYLDKKQKFERMSEEEIERLTTVTDITFYEGD